MAKITSQNRELFAEKSQPHKDEINAILANEKKVLASIEKDSAEGAHKKIILCEQVIYAVTLHLGINELSFEILGIKNNDALNDARKLIYKAIIYLEDIVSNYIDVAYSEIEDKLELISDISLDKRYYLIRKLGLAIKMLIEAFGDNSKWKWSFVELQGRFATVMKNLIDWKEASKNYFDSGSEGDTTTVLYIRLVKKYIEQAAKEYRDRYELSTHRIDDMRLAINYIMASRRIALVIDEQADAEELKKRAQVWKEKLDNDQKKGLAS